MKTEYTAIISFKVDIEADSLEAATYTANQAIPTHFRLISTSGAGEYLRGLAPVIYLREAEGGVATRYRGGK
jgi:hypothetical protein